MATYESKKYDIPIQADTIANQSVSNAEFQTLDGISTGSTIAAQLNTKLDSGEIILQKKVKISKNETEASLAKKILVQEHKLYPKAILKVFNF